MFLPREDPFPSTPTTVSVLPSRGEATLIKRDAPKIGGSVGGFIAVVVCLVLIIVVASMAALYLIREEADGATHQRRGRRAMPSSPSYSKPTSSPTPPSFSRFRQYLSSISFPKMKFTPRSGSERANVEAGWVKTGSADDWTTSSPRRDQITFATPPHMTSRSILASESIPTILRTSSPTTTIASPVSRPTSESIVSSVRFDLQAVRGLVHHDPYAPSPQPTILGIHTQYTPPTSSGAPSPSPLHPVRSASPEPMSPLHESTSRSDITSDISSQSRVTTRTFEGGSKFIEGF
ncbi:hypothetical protein AX16_002888 [Volvariella volvacea WC 439]|nr:hypothetical protein AX16_002888 [Volvariella volvacea WC 439]